MVPIFLLIRDKFNPLEIHQLELSQLVLVRTAGCKGWNFSSNWMKLVVDPIMGSSQN